MNARQTIAVIFVGLMLLINTLFPPAFHRGKEVAVIHPNITMRETIVPSGFKFLLTMANEAHEVNLPQWTTQYLVILLIGGVAYWLLRNDKPGSRILSPIQTPYSTWQPEWSATEHELFRDFGFAAFKAQMLESSLVHLLLAADKSGMIKLENKKSIELELVLSKKTLGPLIEELRKGGISADLDEILKDALEARNFLTHHFFNWHSKAFATENERGSMLRELQKLRFRIGKATDLMANLRADVYVRVFGVTEDELRLLYEEYKRQNTDHTP